MKKYIKIFIFIALLLLLLLLYFNKQYIPISLFQIKSGSMLPEIGVGDIIAIMKKEEYKEDDIITYQVNDSYFITHRIVKKEEDGYVTKGDNNNTADREKVKVEQINGKVIFNSKILGKVFNYRFYIVFVLILFLIFL